MKLHAALWLLMVYYAQRLKTTNLAEILAEAPTKPEMTPVDPRWVVTAATRLRARTRVPCLPAALAVRHVLRGMGRPAGLRLGVRPDQFLDGHAWVELEGKAYLKDDQRWSAVWREDV